MNQFLLSEIAHFEELVESTRGDIQHLVPRAAKILKNQPEVKACLELDVAAGSRVLACLDRELVHALLRRTLLADVELELAFTRLRKAYLTELGVLGQHGALAASIAIQCFHNDYAWSVTASERAYHEALCQSETLSEDEVIKLAMYGPLFKISAQRFEPHFQSSNSELRFLLSKQLREPLVELKHQSSFPSLGKIEDSTSLRVARQYHESPYPRWFSMPAHSPGVLSERLSNWCPGVFDDQSSDILVPGCGTGRHQVYLASTFPHSQVIGLDLSLASLAYGKRRADEFGLSNIEFWHGDLLALAAHDDWRERFGFIDAIGVLHHLRDPVQGCRALARVLAPGGLVRVGVYSRRARREAGIEAARKRLAGSEGLREARQQLLDSKLTQFLDFFTLNGFRDLIFPAHETTYSLREAVEMLRLGGLQAVSLQVSNSIKAQFRKDFGPDLNDWSGWDRYEQLHPNTFAGMYHLLAVAA